MCRNRRKKVFYWIFFSFNIIIREIERKRRKKIRIYRIKYEKKKKKEKEKEKNIKKEEKRKEKGKRKKKQEVKSIFEMRKIDKSIKKYNLSKLFKLLKVFLCIFSEKFLLIFHIQNISNFC